MSTVHYLCNTQSWKDVCLSGWVKVSDVDVCMGMWLTWGKWLERDWTSPHCPGCWQTSTSRPAPRWSSPRRWRTPRTPAGRSWCAACCPGSPPSPPPRQATGRRWTRLPPTPSRLVLSGEKLGWKYSLAFIIIMLTLQIIEINLINDGRNASLCPSGWSQLIKLFTTHHCYIHLYLFSFRILGAAHS